jgi:uncharacterized protein YkwD
MKLDDSKFRSILLNEHNRLRANPKEYIPILKKYLDSVDDNNFVSFSCGKKYKLYEGPQVINEAITYIQNLPPKKTLTFDASISKAAQNWADTLCKDTNQIKLNSLSERLDRFLEWDFSCAENVDFDSSHPRDVLVNLLIDDGIPSRCHRENLFREDMNYIGIGLSNHPQLGKCVVINYVSCIKNQIQKNHEIYTNYTYYEDNKITENADNISIDLKEIKNQFSKTSYKSKQIETSNEICKNEEFIYLLEKNCEYNNNLIILKNENILK